MADKRPPEKIVAECISAAHVAVGVILDDLHCNRVADAAARAGQLKGLLAELLENVRGRGW